MKNIIEKIGIFIWYSLLRIIMLPTTIIIPRSKSKITVIGYSGAYIGNAKAVHEHLISKTSFESFFFTDCKKVITNNPNKSIYYLKNIKSIYKILRSYVIVVDSTQHRLIGLLSFRRKVIQLWHGNGMKEIALMTMNKNKIIFNLRNLATRFIGSLIKYDLVYFSSQYAFDTRKKAFLFKHYRYNGQPRNDIIFNPKDNFQLTVLYVPTWREGNTSTLNKINLFKIDEFCSKHNISFILKLHPQEKYNNINSFKNIIILDKKYDVYDSFHNIDLMITDYSSIYFDFLLLDRPLIFYPFDKKDYLEKRKIVYDYDEITPGPIVYDTNELLNQIYDILISKKDYYKEKRAKVRDLFYEFQDNKSCERITEDIKKIIFHQL